MTTLADFLKDLFTENVRKLLQPANLVVAVVFVLLNWLLIFPSLVSNNVPIISVLYGLSAAWQIIVMVNIVLVVAYLLLSNTDAIRTLMTGKLWKDSLILGKGSIFLQKKIWKVPTPEQRERDKQNSALTDKEKIALNYMNDILPTRLGNILHRATYNLNTQHNMDMSRIWEFFWPRLEREVAGDEFLSSRLNNQKATLDFLLNLAFVLGFFAIEQVLIQIFWLKEKEASISAVSFLALGYIVYRAAINTAQIWCDLVEMAFDIHREKLRQTINMRPFTSKKDEHAQWKNLTDHIFLGTISKDLFSLPTLPEAHAIASANATVTLQTSIEDLIEPVSEDLLRGGKKTRIKKIYQYIHYLLLVSNVTMQGSVESATNEVQGVYVVVSDPRVPTIDTPPVCEQLCQAEAKILDADEGSASKKLLWHIKKLSPNGSTVLSYKLPSVFLRVTTTEPDKLSLAEGDAPDNPEGSEIHSYNFTITSDAPAPTDAKVLVLDNRIKLPASPPLILKKINGKSERVDVEKLSRPEQYCWLLEKLPIAKEEYKLRRCAHRGYSRWPLEKLKEYVLEYNVVLDKEDMPYPLK